MKTLKLARKNPSFPKTWKKNKKVEWRQTDHPNFFVSNEGTIINVSKMREVTRTKHQVTENRAYLVARIGDRVEYVHRIVAKAFLGNYPDLVVHHIDGNTFNNRLDNLEWTTQKRNIQLAKRVSPRKTQDWEVEKIFLLQEEGFSRAQIASIVGVSYLTVWRILTGKTHK